MSGDVLTAATALAGLLLIFLIAGIDRFEAIDKFLQGRDFRSKSRRGAWFVFIGFALAVSAALLALFGKWFHVEWCVFIAVIAFVVSALWSVASAIGVISQFAKD